MLEAVQAKANANMPMAAHDLLQRGAQGHSAVRTLREGAAFAITEPVNVKVVVA